MVIFVDEQIPFLRDSLSTIGKVHSFNGRTLSRKELIDYQCDILFVRSTTKVDRNLLEGTKVQFVGTATSGIDHIDIDYLNSKGIYFAEAKGSNANSVAEYVVFSILHWAKIYQINIDGLTIGIVGFGHIGTLVAKYTHLLGLKVYINDPPLFEMHQATTGNPFPEYTTYLEFDELLKVSQVVTNHVPKTQDGKFATLGMFNKDNLALIQNNALFIHTSRGGVVVEKDLLEAKKKKDLTLVVDVWDNEPNINTELVRECIICTPHIAGYSFDGKLRGTLKMLNEFERFTNIKPDYSDIQKEMEAYKPMDINLFKDKEFVYQHLLQSKQLLEDTIQFKKILLIETPEERSKYFDWLRKQYPKRREVL